jgi:hypothetical protein
MDKKTASPPTEPSVEWLTAFFRRHLPRAAAASGVVEEWVNAFVTDRKRLAPEPDGNLKVLAHSHPDLVHQMACPVCNQGKTFPELNAPEPAAELTDAEAGAVFMKTGIPKLIVDGVKIGPKEWFDYARAIAAYVRQPQMKDSKQKCVVLESPGLTLSEEGRT